MHTSKAGTTSVSARKTTKLVNWHPHHKASEGGKVLLDETLLKQRWIYHRLPRHYARPILEARHLRLQPVDSWNDPYEAWWCTGLFNRPSPLADVNAFGLCCTTSHLDEPAWRMAAFRRRSPIVRIRFEVKSLLAAGSSLVDERPCSLFLGKVRYQREKALLDLAQSLVNGEHKEVSRTAANMLLQKRKAFSSEKEARLLWLDRRPPRKAVFLPIDPTEVITQVMTSPYATPEEHKEIKRHVMALGIKCVASGMLWKPFWPATINKTKKHV